MGRTTDVPSPWDWKRGVFFDLASSSKAKLVAAALKLYMHNHSGDCFPGKAALIRLTGLSKNTLNAAITELEAAGWLSINKRRGGPGGHGLVYTRRGSITEPLRGSTIEPQGVNH